MHPSFHQAVENARVIDLQSAAAPSRVVVETRRHRRALHAVVSAGVAKRPRHAPRSHRPAGPRRLLAA